MGKRRHQQVIGLCPTADWRHLQPALSQDVQLALLHVLIASRTFLPVAFVVAVDEFHHVPRRVRWNTVAVQWHDCCTLQHHRNVFFLFGLLLAAGEGARAARESIEVESFSLRRIRRSVSCWADNHVDGNGKAVVAAVPVVVLLVVEVLRLDDVLNLVDLLHRQLDVFAGTVFEWNDFNGWRRRSLAFHLIAIALRLSTVHVASRNR